MGNSTQRLITILGIGWLAFLGAGFGLRQTLRGPAVTVVITTSYCEPDQWQQITNEYRQLYEQHQQRRLTIEQVIYLNDFEEKIIDPIPSADEVANFNPFGREITEEKVQAATANHPDATFLICNN